ncbi:hypothetical protein B0H66DRAFT_21720 [Apodospora peruviana]|uniref:Elongin-A n=1 Tax=Apodospora peruviana TaxID=516989 RepID=A0AAE0MEE6_9PEZI|nr:hypothetical protein B0H66DRAFT_21720 [Apodospora peruviana]
MAPPSLVEMCRKVLITNLPRLAGFGDMPLNDTMRESLKHVKTAKHLRELELGSVEDIYEETPHIWERLISKNFPYLKAEHNWVPSDPRLWHKVYAKYEKIQKEADAQAAEKLKAAMSAYKDEVDSRRVTIVAVPERPKLHLSKQWPPPKKPTVLQKTRNQVLQEAKRLKLPGAKGRPPVQTSTLKQAPKGMLNEKRIARQVDSTATLIRAPRVRPSLNATDEQARLDREARLLRIKNLTAKPASGATVLTFDDDEEENTNSNKKRKAEDDLFGDSSEFRAATPPAIQESGSGFLSLEDLATSPSNSLSAPRRSNKVADPKTSQTSTSSATFSSAASPPQTAAVKRRRALFLSARPGANTAISPPRVASGSGASPPALDPQVAGRPTRPARPVTGTSTSLAASKPLLFVSGKDGPRPSASSPPPATGGTAARTGDGRKTPPPPNRVVKRKPAVDIFMPTSKRPRN